MSTEIHSFTDALDLAVGHKRLLLGNGFSIACKRDIFSYEALLKEADFSSASSCVRRAFDEFHTQNFELIIRKLYDAARLLQLYDAVSSDVCTQMRSDAETLKEVLVTVIAGKHPSRPGDISESQYDACGKFLSFFDAIYTVSYDLLLYWALIHDMNGQRRIAAINDGFVMPEEGEQEYVIWDGSHANTQNVFYLHGGLHIFDAGTEFQKLTFCNTQIPLMDQIRKAMNERLYPHFVAEGTWQEKLERLNHSVFLNKGYKSLQGIGDALFVYGHSLADNDSHILHIIERNPKITQLFVSLYGSADSEANRGILARAEAMRIARAQCLAEREAHRKTKRKGQVDELQVIYFDAESAEVWG